MNTKYLEEALPFSYDPTTDRRKLIINIIKKLGCASTEILSVLTGLHKAKIGKILRSLSKHSRIRLITVKKTYYWSVQS